MSNANSPVKFLRRDAFGVGVVLVAGARVGTYAPNGKRNVYRGWYFTADHTPNEVRTFYLRNDMKNAAIHAWTIQRAVARHAAKVA